MAVHVVPVALAVAMLAVLWGGTAASAGVVLAQSRASVSASPSSGRVKLLHRPASREGARGFAIRDRGKTLGNASLFTEIFNLNKGRLRVHSRVRSRPRHSGVMTG